MAAVHVQPPPMMDLKAFACSGLSAPFLPPLGQHHKFVLLARPPHGDNLSMHSTQPKGTVQNAALADFNLASGILWIDMASAMSSS